MFVRKIIGNYRLLSDLSGIQYRIREISNRIGYLNGKNTAVGGGAVSGDVTVGAAGAGFAGYTFNGGSGYANTIYSHANFLAGKKINLLGNILTAISDVDGVYVSVGIIPNSEDIINNLMNKRRRDEDGILSISTYLEGDDGTVIWENTDKEILEQFNIYSLEDSKKCQSTAYILSVIEISDKNIISETNILVKSGALYYYSSNYGRGTGRQKKTRNLSDTSRDGGNCCPFFYDGCKTSLLTKEVIMSDILTRSR